jgi:hypothetical protein
VSGPSPTAPRWVRATEIGLCLEVEAMLGGRDRARRRPGLADFLLNHLRAARAEREAREERSRRRDQSRRHAIACGERSPLSSAELESYYRATEA